MRHAAALLLLGLLSCASADPEAEARAWIPGRPLPSFLVRCASVDAYAGVDNYPLLLALVLGSETDGLSFECAAERALLAGGPSRLFADLAACYDEHPELLLRDRHRLLDRRLQSAHVRVQAAYLSDEDLPAKRQEEVGLKIVGALEEGTSWEGVLQSPSTWGAPGIGDLGTFVLSPTKRNARPFSDVEVPRDHAALLLTLSKRGSLVRRDEAGRRMIVYWVTDAWPGRKAAEAPFYADKQRLLSYLDGAGKEHPVRTRADWARRRLHILENFEKVAGPLPDVFARGEILGAPGIDGEDVGSLFRGDVKIRSEGGDAIPAVVFIPKGREGRLPAVLCLHQTTPLGKKEPAGMGNRNLAYAKELAERGFVTLVPDYPGYGDYKIDPYAMGYASATMKGIWNHRRAVDFLQSIPQVDPDRIGAIGHSLGGHNSIFAAAFDERIKAVVSSCGFNAFPKYYGGNLTGWSHKGYMPRIAEVYGKDPKKMPFDFTELVAALAPRPFFINAPLRDANFEVSGVRDCVEAARPVYELLGAKDALVAVHPDAAHDFPPDVRRAAYEFLEKALVR
jgi:dienelactone hydrolase